MYLKTSNFIFFIAFIFLQSINAQAQFGIQINGGLMNYGGDLQSDPYTFKEARPTIGGALLYNIHSFFLRGAATYGSIQADDKKVQVFKTRNLNFKSKMYELNFCVGYQYTKNEDSKLVPYIFAGVGVYHYNPYTFYNGKRVNLQPLSTEGEGLSIYPDRKPYSLTNIECPMGLGVNYKLSPNFLIGIEFNTRLLFTDYLDDVSSTYPDEATLLKERGQLAVDLSYRGDEINPGAAFPSGGTLRGNSHHNDNYYTSVVTLTYIFPEPNVFGNASGHGKHAAKISCPPKIH